MNIYRLFTYLFFITPLIPNFGALDYDSTQYIYLLLVNVTFTIYHFSFKRETRINWNNQLFFFLVFLIISVLSVLSSMNKIESIFEITHIFIFFYSLLSIFQICKANKNFNNDILNGFILLLGVELLYIFSQISELIVQNKSINPKNIEGVESNRNITAFLIAIKLPIAYYLFFKEKKVFRKILFFILVILSFYAIFFLKSRGAIIAVLFSVVSLIPIALTENKKRGSFRDAIIIILALLFSLSTNFLLRDKGETTVERLSSFNKGRKDGSINERIQFYEAAADQFMDKPLNGIGIGNWKIVGTDYYKENISGYMVPKNVHNDFLEFAAELGMFGVIAFLLFCFYPIFMYWKKRNSKVYIIHSFLLVSVLIYIFDSSINFPFSRPSQVICFLLIISVLAGDLTEQKELGEKKAILIKLLTFLLIIPSFYVSVKLYISQVQQVILTVDFNRGDGKSLIPYEMAKTFNYTFPNITLTTFPISAMMARNFILNDNIEKAIELCHYANKANPFIQYPNFLLGKIYQQKGIKDSARYYLKKAYLGLPENKLHQTNYLEILANESDQKEIMPLFDKLSEQKNVQQWRIFLNFLYNTNSINSSYKDSIFNISTKHFSDDILINQYYKFHKIGIKKITEAENLAKEARIFFDKRNFKKAAKYFENAAKIDYLKIEFFENAALSYIQIDNLEKAENLIDRSINELNSKSGKSEFIKAMILDKKNEKDRMCSFLFRSSEKGYTQAKSFYKSNCLYQNRKKNKKNNNNIDNLN